MKNTMYLDTSGKKCIVGIVDKKGKSYSVIEDNRKITFRKCNESIRRSIKKGKNCIFRYRKSSCMYRATVLLQVLE